jgi:uncharacterized membrane protein
MLNLALVIFFFTAAAMVYKAANQAGCRQLGTITAERTAVILFIGLYIAFFDKLRISFELTGFAAIGGAAIFFSRWTLLLALVSGKVSSSWTVVNLSIAIPTLASIFIWGEIPGVKTIIGLALVPPAVMLLREKRYVE